ncbi:hypothetical protein [Peptacetobacter hiranonis]|nr:hypothetical protein [Peptacetobacter hiranonis]MEE0249065.1 hypothetical protein [Peptacetobacter hiranonis]
MVERYEQQKEEYDDALCGSLAEKLIVKSKEEVTVVFKDRTEIGTQA